EQVERELDPRTHRRPAGEKTASNEPEPHTVRHLRAHSRYLAPRFGLLSTDTWTLLAIYIRNLFINALTAGSAVLALVLLCRLVVVFFTLPRLTDVMGWLLAVGFAFFLLRAFIVMRHQLALLAREEQQASGKSPPSSRSTGGGTGWKGQLTT